MLLKPKNENILWIYFLRPILFVLISLIILAALYLYLVPLTNIVGMGLFADYICPTSSGVWGICGRISKNLRTGVYKFDPNGDDIAVGFFVFLLTLVTCGLYILGTILYISSRNKGYVKKFDHKLCFNVYCGCGDTYTNYDELYNNVWHPTNKNKFCCGYESGLYMYYTSMVCFTIATFVSSIMLSVWVGRYISIISIPQCMPYINTRIGLYGCVSSLNTTFGQYVGGQNCNDCAGIGFAILWPPLLGIILLSIFILKCVKKCKENYNIIKLDLEKESRKNIVPIKSILITHPFECEICCHSRNMYTHVSCCKQQLCFNCWDKLNTCPFCRQIFNKEIISQFIDITNIS